MQAQVCHNENGPDASISTRARIKKIPFACTCMLALVCLHSLVLSVKTGCNARTLQAVMRVQ